MMCKRNKTLFKPNPDADMYDLSTLHPSVTAKTNVTVGLARCTTQFFVVSSM